MSGGPVPAPPDLRAARVWLLALALCTAFLFQGTRGLYETTEGRYAEVGREMVATGDWLVPHLEGHAHWTKPPLTYWSIALGLEAVGRNTWGARLYGAFALVFVTLAVTSLGTTLWDPATGLLAGLMYVTSPLPVVGGNVVSPDLLLSLWEATAVLCFWRALRSDDPRASRRWIAGMWAAFGLAFLTKGPPGLLPLVALMAWVVIRRRRGLAAPRFANGIGVLLFLVLGLGWYVVVVARDRSLVSFFLREEVWGRVATPMHHRNHRWFMAAPIFLPPLVIGSGAWLATGIRDLRAWCRTEGWRARLGGALRGAEGMFLLLWLCVPLVVFVVSKSRLPLYVLPLFPALVLGPARIATRVRGAEPALRRGLRVAVASAVVLIALKGAAALLPSPQNMAQLAASVRALGAVDRVVVVDDPGLHGLAFYLDGRVDHLTSADLKPALQQIESDLTTDPGRSVVLVTTRGAPAPLVRACAGARVACRVEDAARGRYQLWRIRPRTG